jgi:hypothetical protein
VTLAYKVEIVLSASVIIIARYVILPPGNAMDVCTILQDSVVNDVKMRRMDMLLIRTVQVKYLHALYVL